MGAQPSWRCNPAPKGRVPDSELLKLELRTFLDICEAVNTPRSLACHLMIISGELDQYFGLPAVDPDSPFFADDYLVTQMLRKNPRLPLGIDRAQKALDSWWEAERGCAASNVRIGRYADGFSSVLDSITPVLKRARAEIYRILGSLSARDLRVVERGFRFGPGATSTIKGRDVLLSKKMTSRFEVTQALLPLLPAVVPDFWGSFNGGWLDATVVQGNAVTFVPKDATKDRAIAIEPHGNIYVQLGIGALLRKRLAAIGLDLDIQADVNRLFARYAQVDRLATIDLSSASDTVSYELVRFLLPPRWFHLLEICRSRYSRLPDGTQVPLSKFSSMGNGYTFELETLIFYALSVACGSLCPQVFGDDIIVEQSVAPSLVGALELLGFKVNDSKTFLAGRFFESCGEDYHDGVNVRPIFLRGEHETTDEAVVRYANRVRAYSHRIMARLGCDRRFLRPWLRLIAQSAEARRTGIPLGYGDSGLIRNFDEICPRKAGRGWQGFIAPVLSRRKVVSRRTSQEGAYLAALAFGAHEVPRSIETPRGAKGALYRSSIHVSEWYNLGPWI